jgi:sucrose phosphorylase
MHRFGGFVSMKANADGSQSPYEINISLFDACMGTRRGMDHMQVPRFLCSQAIMLAMQGIPAMYIHSLTASPNDIERVEQTGRTRSINRRVWQADALEALLDNPVTAQAQVFSCLSRMLLIRRQQPAFHPSARQDVIKISSDLFILKRTNEISGQVIHALHNVTDRTLTLPLAALGFLTSGLRDLLGQDDSWRLGDELVMAPYQAVWLTP